MSAARPGSWTRPADVRAQVRRLWDRGELLRHLVSGEPSFPLRLRLKAPTSAEIAQGFDEVRAWVAELRTLPAARIQTRQVSHRLFGANALPQALWLDSLDDALALIGKRREAGRFQSLLELVQAGQPGLLPWLARRPLRALELAEVFERLVEVAGWIQAHPHPGIYLRQVDLPGVHTKLIEAHRAVLEEWLALLLAPEAIAGARPGVSGFAARYGFRERPVRIRFRPLDPALSPLPGAACPDITLDAESFAGLGLDQSRVFITENEINFLAFPPLTGSLVLFGSGYGWEALAQARWLERCPIHYWGDIDTHGFAILDRLRGHFPHVASLLMDRETLMAHQAVWGREQRQVSHDLPNLSREEHALFDDLRQNRIRPGLRLEQERIGFSFLQAALRGKGDGAKRKEQDE